MIWRLIQFEKQSYKFALPILCLYAVFFYYSGRVALRGLLIVPGAWGLALLFGGAARLRRVNRFQAALPIRARDIYCAKNLEEFAAGGLLVLAAAAVLVMSHGVPTGIAIAVPCEVGTLMVLGRIAERAFRPAEPATPAWWGRVVGAFVFSGSIAIGGQVPATSHGRWVDVPSAATISLLALCVAGSAALFWITWSSIPDAMLRASTEPEIEKHPQRKSWLPTFAWQPLLRALVGLGTLFSCGLLFVFAIFGLERSVVQPIAILTCWFAIWGKLLNVRTRDRWVLALPFSRRKIFLAVAAVPLGSLALGSALHFSDAPQSALSILYGFAAVSIAGLLPGFFIGVPFFLRRSRRFWGYVRLAAMLAIAIASALVMAFAFKSTAAVIENWHLTALTVLARSPWSSVAPVALLAAAYWLASCGFSRMEARPSRWIAARGSYR